MMKTIIDNDNLRVLADEDEMIIEDKTERMEALGWSTHPTILLYIIQEYQKHFRFKAYASGEWRGVIGSSDSGLADPNSWFILEKVEE